MSDMDIDWQPGVVVEMAAQLSKLGNEYRAAIADAFSVFNNIGLEEKWVGKNFNIIANLFNEHKGEYDGWASFLQITAPQKIYVISERKANLGGGSVSLALTPVTEEIPMVASTLEKADGSMKVDVATVRSIMNQKFTASCEAANKIVSDYYTEAESVNSMVKDAAIVEICRQLDTILVTTRNSLNFFSTNIQELTEKTLNNIEITDEEAVRMAQELAQIMRV